LNNKNCEISTIRLSKKPERSKNRKQKTTLNDIKAENPLR